MRRLAGAGAVAHITMAFRYNLPKVVVGMVKARGSFNRMADRAARTDAESPDRRGPGRVAAGTTSATHGSRRAVGTIGALGQDVIHGLDITVGLGFDRRPPPERVGLVLGSLQPSQLKFFGVDLTGLQLRADDLDWCYGGGDPMTGRAQDLLLAVCGRKLPAGQLHGEPSRRFTR